MMEAAPCRRSSFINGPPRRKVRRRRNSLRKDPGSSLGPPPSVGGAPDLFILAGDERHSSRLITSTVNYSEQRMRTLLHYRSLPAITDDEGSRTSWAFSAAGMHGRRSCPTRAYAATAGPRPNASSGLTGACKPAVLRARLVVLVPCKPRAFATAGEKSTGSACHRSLLRECGLRAIERCEPCKSADNNNSNDD